MPAMSSCTEGTDTVIDIDSATGRRWLVEAQTGGFYQPRLHAIFSKQTGATHCGLQTCALVMSAPYLKGDPRVLLHLGAPSTDVRYTENGLLLMEQTQQVLTRQHVARNGMTLTEIFHVLKSHGLTASKHHANETSSDVFRDLAKQVLSEEDSSQAVLVNYHMSALGQRPFGGHHSPLAAYHPDTDRFLVLDTWPTTHVGWVRTQDLFNAMATKDTNDDAHRGFCIVKTFPSRTESV